MHFGNPPLHYVAEALVVDIVVLPAHRTLCPFFEFVLTMTIINGSGPLRKFGLDGKPTSVLTHLFPVSP
jgi:hypothetical protein